MSEKKDTKEKDEDILETARQRFHFASEADFDIRKEALDDLRFSAGDQWPETISKARNLDRRPCLTINKLPQSIHLITNDQRQNAPAIKISPVDDFADKDTAKIYQGIIRHIEETSGAAVAYSTAFDCAVRSGRGFFRVITDYCDPMSFDLEARIRRIKNPFSVYLDPNFQEPDGSDADWGFVFEDIAKEEFKLKYPKAQISQMNDWTSIGDTYTSWITAENCRVAEYFYKDIKEETIVLLSTDETVLKSDLPEYLPPEIQIIKERSTFIPLVRWVKTNGHEILERTDWPGKYIPIIPVLGEELDIEGKRVLSGIVRHAKDPQRMYNYWASSETEAIALAPRAPFIGYEGQFEGHEAEWATANTRNHAYLQVNQTGLNGQVLPLPQRNAFEPAVQAITQARMLASDDLKSTTGLYDASLGNRSNETSGVAIAKRRDQGQTANFHFFDNMARSIRHAGRILVDIIPRVYDTARAIRILGEEGQEEIVRINQEFQHKNELKTYDLSKGKYDVTVSMGPSFESKRQEAVQSMIELTRAQPQATQAILDLMVKNMDWPGADEISERLKKLLPPGMLDEKNKKPLPPEVQQQLEQMSGLIEQLTQKLNEASDTINTKKMELESKERIENAKLQTQIEIELAKMGSQEAQMLLKNEIQEIQERLSLLDQYQPINDDFDNESFEDSQAGFEEALSTQEQQPTDGFSSGQTTGDLNQ